MRKKRNKPELTREQRRQRSRDRKMFITMERKLERDLEFVKTKTEDELKDIFARLKWVRRQLGKVS
jgi:hypothetical protein